MSKASCLFVLFFATAGAHAQLCHTQELVAADPQPNGRLGMDLAMSADALVAGAFQADLGVNGAGFRGALYIWRRLAGAWTFEAKVDGLPAPATHLGRAVAIDGDVIVASGFASSMPYERAQVFRRVAGTWTHEQALAPSDPVTASAVQPRAVAIDGIRIAVGHQVASGLPTVPLQRTGAVYIYEHNGTWLQTAKLVPANAAVGDVTGQSLAMRGGLLAFSQRPASVTTGPSAVHVYEFPGGTPMPTGTLVANNPGASNSFAWSVATDGVRVAVGDIGDTGLAGSQGAVHVYLRQGGSWVEEQVVRPATPAGAGAQFGIEVAIDGPELVVTGGAPARIWRFHRVGSTWGQQAGPIALAASASSSALRGIDAAVGMEALQSSAGAVDTFLVGAQAAGYGLGLAGTGGIVPTLLTPVCPFVGNPLTIDLDRARGGSWGLIGWSLQAADAPFVGGHLLIGPTFLTQLVVLSGTAGASGVGAAAVVMPPLSPAFVGLQVHLQAGVADPAAPQGFALTRGLEIVIG